MDPVRLACVKHAASVRPEPGSNSPNKNIQKTPQKRAIPTKKTKKTKHNQNSCAKPTHKKSKNKNTLSRTKTTTPHQPKNPGQGQNQGGIFSINSPATRNNFISFSGIMSTQIYVTRTIFHSMPVRRWQKWEYLAVFPFACSWGCGCRL